MPVQPPVYVLGGFQTDFARNFSKEGKHLSAMIREVTLGALEATEMDPKDIEVAHVGNFAAELYTMQGHLGALFLEVDPCLYGLPTARHEAACASGAISLLAAMRDIRCGDYNLACIVGVEQMKTVGSAEGGDYLGTAAWYEREAKGVSFPFPKLFGQLADVYDERYGLKYEYLAEISTKNYANARLNPVAQTRDWYMNKAHACTQSDYNQAVGGRIRITDCSQVTDGAAVTFLASEAYAKRYAATRGLALESLPRILGWGHRTAPMLFDDKMKESEGQDYILPWTRRTILDAYERAGVTVDDLCGIETHDCFTSSEYVAYECFGLAKPGHAYQALDSGIVHLGGKIPVNPSGGLIGAGHPVGGTGVRQVLDAYKQVTGQAGDYQVEGARRFATLNIGGSATTNVAFVIGFPK